MPLHRDYDVSREADLIEEVGADPRARPNLPETLPESPGRVGRPHPRAAAAAPGRGRDARPRLRRDRAVSLTEPGTCDRLRHPGGRRSRASRSRVRNPLSVEHSVLRTTLLGIAARLGRLQPRPRRRAGSPCSSPGAPTCAVALACGGHPGRRVRGRAPAARPTSPTGSDCLVERRAARARLARRGAAGRTSSRSRERSRPSPGSSAPSWRSSPRRSPSCTRAARRRSTWAARPAGWIGEIHPLVLRAWELEATGPRGSSSTSTTLIGASEAGREQLRGRHHVSRRVPGPRGRGRATTSPRRGSARPCWRAAASCCARRASSTSTRGEQVGEGRKSLALRLEFRAPDRTLTDEEVAERRAAITAELERIGGSLRGASWEGRRVLVAGASGYAGALAAELVSGHPGLELARATARSDVGTRLERALPAVPRRP